jgi:hypothetical protein
MKRAFVFAAIFVACLVAALNAQDVVGTWQGTTQVQGRDVRIQFKVTNDGGLKALMYNVDAPGGGVLPANVTMQSGGVRFTMPGVNG